jgi:hypothetical protein
LKRAKALLVVGLVAAGSLFVAAPAQASCQTNPDIGDWCKVRDAAIRALCSTKPGQYTQYCA